MTDFHEIWNKRHWRPSQSHMFEWVITMWWKQH